MGDLASITEKSILGTLKTGVVVHSPTSEVIYCNPRACELLGLSENQMLGKVAIDPHWHFLRDDGSRLPVEDYPISQVLNDEKALENMILGVVSASIEKTIWVLVNADPYFAEDSSLSYVSINFHDITKQKELDDKLKETLIQLQESISASDVGLWNWNLTNDQVSFSKEYAAQIGYAEGELSNKYSEWESRVHPDDIARAKSEVEHSIQSLSKQHESVFRFRHKDGSYRWILAHGSVLKDEQGHAVRMIGSHIDITARRNIEEELRQAQKMEAIGHLAGGIAHDFNNQLTVIMGLTDLLALNLQQSQLEHYVKQLAKATERSMDLTNQLLAFSRQQPIKRERINIHTLIHEEVDMLKRILGSRIEFSVQLMAQHHHINGDFSLLQNALLNLSINARDAMPGGGILSISTNNIEVSSDASELNSGEYLQIDVRDSGSGIAKADLAKIFEPYYTTKEKGKGTGIGLASVNSTIEQLGGKITVESEFGEGTCFHINLPVA